MNDTDHSHSLRYIPQVIPI